MKKSQRRLVSSAWLPEKKGGSFLPKAVRKVVTRDMEKKSVTVSIVSPSLCHEVMRQDAMILVFWMLSFKSAFSPSFFTFIKGLFNSSLHYIFLDEMSICCCYCPASVLHVPGTIFLTAFGRNEPSTDCCFVRFSTSYILPVNKYVFDSN